MRMAASQKCLVAVRVRGVGDASPQIEKTLENLNLTRNCHITLLDSRPSFLGMLKKVRHFVTWGEITKETTLLLLKKRGRLVGDRKVDDTYATKLGYNTLEELAEAIFTLEIKFRHLPELKPVFRAHPPKKGYKGKIKRSFTAGGVTGYRGDAINKLVKSMV